MLYFTPADLRQYLIITLHEIKFISTLMFAQVGLYHSRTADK